MREKIAKILQLWPVFLLVGVYCMSWFNPDLVIAPALIIKYKMFAKPLLVLIIGTIGFLEMLGGYKGWSGMRGLVVEKLKDKEFVKKLRGEVRVDNRTEGLEIRFIKKYLKFTGDGSYYEEPVSKVWLFRNVDRALKWFVVILKAGGIIAMFIVGLIPVPGFRVIPDILCGSARWKMGFISLSIGNFLKTVGIIYGWSKIL